MPEVSVPEVSVQGPMSGVRILDLSVALSGPLAVGLLVDQGATAVKVETLPFGDQGRYVGVSSGGISAMFQIANRGKRAIAVNCRDRRGRDIVLQLADDADVVVQNMRPGAVERLGLGYEDIAARNPGIIYASLSGFGPDGPYAHRRVYDSVVQAQAGMVANQTGIHDEAPRFLRQAAADKVTSYTAAQAITAALFARERGAPGQHLSLSMLDASVAFLFADSAGHEIALDNTQPELPQSLTANQRALKLRDGYVVVTPVTDAEFHGLTRVFGVDSSDPRLATTASRWGNKALMSEAMRAVHAAAPQWTVAQAIAALEEHDVPFGVVLAIEDIASDPQVMHNDLLDTHDHPVMGRVRQHRPPTVFSATPALLRERSAPTYGQHNDEVLTELGWGDRLAELRAGEVIAP